MDASSIIHLAWVTLGFLETSTNIAWFLHIVQSTISMSLNLSFYSKNIQNLRALLIRMMMDASFTLTEKLSQSVVITHSCFIFLVMQMLYTVKFSSLDNVRKQVLYCSTFCVHCALSLQLYWTLINIFKDYKFLNHYFYERKAEKHWNVHHS